MFGGRRLRCWKGMPVVTIASSVLQWPGDDHVRARMYADLVPGRPALLDHQSVRTHAVHQWLHLPKQYRVPDRRPGRRQPRLRDHLVQRPLLRSQPALRPELLDRSLLRDQGLQVRQRLRLRRVH